MVQDTVLSGMCLGLLGSIFYHTNKGQAMKMLQTCLVFSKRSNCLLLEEFALETLETDEANLELQKLQAHIQEQQIKVKELIKNIIM